MIRAWMIGAVAAGALGFAGTADAEGIKVGVIVSQTGPAASLGVPQAKTVPLLPKTMGGMPVEYIVLDDASDSTKAVANARKLISDDKVDVFVGPSTTPPSLACVPVAGETKTPMITLSASAAIVSPHSQRRRLCRPRTLQLSRTGQSLSAGSSAAAWIGHSRVIGP